MVDKHHLDTLLLLLSQCMYRDQRYDDHVTKLTLSDVHYVRPSAGCAAALLLLLLLL
jgi:hypothetical protein